MSGRKRSDPAPRVRDDPAAYHRAYYQRNRERLLAYQKQWREKNPERFRELRQAWLARQPHKTPRRWGVHAFDKKAYMHAYDRTPERKAARLQRYKERGPRPRPGWTRERRAQLLLEQGGNCAICGTVLTKACQDHDARTRKPRGLLCTNCNHLLGKAKDSTQTLERAIAYLHRYA